MEDWDHPSHDWYQNKICFTFTRPRYQSRLKITCDKVSDRKVDNQFSAECCERDITNKRKGNIKDGEISKQVCSEIHGEKNKKKVKDNNNAWHLPIAVEPLPPLCERMQSIQTLGREQYLM